MNDQDANNQAQPPVTPPPAAPVTTPVAAPAPSAPAADSGYISNPLQLLPASLNALKTNLGTVILALILPLVVLAIIFGGSIVALLQGGSGAVSTPTNPSAAAVAMFGALSGAVLLVIVVAIVYAPVWTVIMVACAKGERVSFVQALKQAPRYALRFLGAGLLAILVIMVGFMMLIVPGLVAIVLIIGWYSLTPYLIVEENLGVMAAIKRSKELTSGHFVEMLGMGLFSAALAALTIVPILGQLVQWLVSMLYMAAPAVRYVQLKQLKSSGAPAPAMHWANWLVIVLAVVASGMSAAANQKAQQSTPGLDNYNYPGIETPVE